MATKTKKRRSYEQFFAELTGLEAPREWQAELGKEPACTNRRIRIPTGFGKTLGVFGAWAYNRLERSDATWPRRLVWTLPMRVLVEQTHAEVRAALDRAGLLWDGRTDHRDRVGVHLLMGGADADDWHLHPEREAVLIGTQDMLLSRALNRGYGAARGRWPMEFGLLAQDSLWVLDEVQLMDVGLATSAQLQAFREQDGPRELRPCRTWWMSATLQPRWLETPDTRKLVEQLAATEIPKRDRTDALWKVKKPLECIKPLEANEWADKAAAIHLGQDKAGGRLTLLIANTVDRAVKIDAALRKRKDLAGVDVRLVHSRFRAHERARWREDFLNKDACSGADRIVVSTQVVEAGVDVSATALMTEVAPWSSLVQRFGRVARYGGTGEVYVLPLQPFDEKQAAPYALEDVSEAWKALRSLEDVGPKSLEAFEAEDPKRLERLYPYDPAHLLLRQELDELFDTTPDLTGADIDVSRFIRSGPERDLLVAWFEPREPGARPDNRVQPPRDALCAVPFLRARDWLCGTETKTKRSPSLLKGRRAWVWNYLEGEWGLARRTDLYPGQVVLVPADQGGYDVARGWDPESRTPVPIVPLATPVPQDASDAAQNAEDLSGSEWKTIATHGREVGEQARGIATELGVEPRLTKLLEMAGRWHDVGKAHPAFQGSIRSPDRPNREDLAKAPPSAWPKAHRYQFVDGSETRAGFRHELASALALFAVLARHEPDHGALVGPWRATLEACGTPVSIMADRPTPVPAETEILRLDPAEFNLVAYLVSAHHGKVRARWHAAPADQTYRPRLVDRERVGPEAMPIRGVREGDVLPELPFCDEGGHAHELPATRLTLAPAAAGLSPITGASWLDRIQELVAARGPFALAWLEALLRAADVRASRLNTQDPLLEKVTT